MAGTGFRGQGTKRLQVTGRRQGKNSTCNLKPIKLIDDKLITSLLEGLRHSEKILEGRGNGGGVF